MRPREDLGVTIKKSAKAALLVRARLVLTHPQLEAFELYHSKGKTVTEIAVHLQISKQAAQQRIKRAHQRMFVR